VRGDGREGGVLAIVGAGGTAGVRELASDLGLETRLWQN